MVTIMKGTYKPKQANVLMLKRYLTTVKNKK